MDISDETLEKVREECCCRCKSFCRYTNIGCKFYSLYNFKKWIKELEA